jgi:hypothetical protein
MLMQSHALAESYTAYISDRNLLYIGKHTPNCFDQTIAAYSWGNPDSAEHLTCYLYVVNSYHGVNQVCFLSMPHANTAITVLLQLLICNLYQGSGLVVLHPPSHGKSSTNEARICCFST